MPIVYVTRKTRFNAAHRLHNPDKSDEWNRETFGKCNSPNWHGHDYRMEVTVAGSPEADTGYVIDLSELKRIVHRKVVDKCDHANLNLDVDFLAGIIPSTENLVIAFWNQIEPEISGGRLTSIRLFETEHNSVEYKGE